jgi:PAP2 superfamily.
VVSGSRLYLGVHYPTDVLGAWLASLAWVLGLRQILLSRAHR